MKSDERTILSYLQQQNQQFGGKTLGISISELQKDLTRQDVYEILLHFKQLGIVEDFKHGYGCYEKEKGSTQKRCFVIKTDDISLIDEVGLAESYAVDVNTKTFDPAQYTGTKKTKIKIDSEGAIYMDDTKIGTVSKESQRYRLLTLFANTDGPLKTKDIQSAFGNHGIRVGELITKTNKVMEKIKLLNTGAKPIRGIRGEGYTIDLDITLI